MKIVLFVISAFLLSFPSLAMAQGGETFRSTDYPLPRFASIGQEKSYVRTGPGSRYPIKWVFHKKYLPVEIVLEFDNWRKIIDHEGEVGWMHLSQLSGKRSALITSEDMVRLYRAPSKTETLIAFLEPNVVASIVSCSTKWCLINAKGYKGWLEKEYIWGVYKNELIRN